MNAQCTSAKLCRNCKRQQRERLGGGQHQSSGNKSSRGRRSGRSGWTPRTTGATSSGEIVTFRQGLGDNDGHTVISDGDKSDREFRREHNHYGDKREGSGRVEDDGGDRGYYTGPGH